MTCRLFAIAAMMSLTASQAASQQSDAARFLLEEQIVQACGGVPGEMDPTGFIEQDLTGDGRDDLIISHEMIQCEDRQPRGTRSQFCGMQVCTVLIYVRQGDLLVLEEEFLGGGVTLGPTRVPVIRGYAHGGDTWTIRWDGSRFR